MSERLQREHEAALAERRKREEKYELLREEYANSDPLDEWDPRPGWGWNGLDDEDEGGS